MNTPEIITTIDALRLRLDAERAKGAKVGFVPTMGYLHEGHGSLAERAVAENDLVVLSIFVNPLQFAPDEDLESYPRDLDRDLGVARDAGVSIVFHPTGDEMYPEPAITTVEVAGFGREFEGASRPTHFAGVATVVAKLFGIVGPCRAYFGEKDFQQLAIVRRLAADLSMPVEVVGCPISREDDGLARSSRNVYLTDQERAAATVVHRALVIGREAIEAGERSADVINAAMCQVIDSEPCAELDYAAVVDTETLVRVDPLFGELRLLAAARIGRPRLLDNLGVTVDSGPGK